MTSMNSGIGIRLRSGVRLDGRSSTAKGGIIEGERQTIEKRGGSNHANPNADEGAKARLNGKGGSGGISKKTLHVEDEGQDPLRDSLGFSREENSSTLRLTRSLRKECLGNQDGDQSKDIVLETQDKTKSGGDIYMERMVKQSSVDAMIMRMLKGKGVMTDAMSDATIRK